jgi:multicomponent K+:H+ antiporter subunit D
MSLMDHLIFFPVLLPLVAGMLLLLPPLHGDLARQRVMVFSVNAALLLVALLLLGKSLTVGPQMYMMGNWQAPFGIALVNDSLASVMLLLTAILALATHLYACAGEDAKGPFFQPLFMFQVMGVNGAFLTNDIFNLFVFFEILLIASYSLLIHGGGKQRTQAAVHYVLLNLVGSAIFLFGLGMIYASFGTLNMADMAYKAGHLSEENIELAKSGGLLLLVVFGLKAALLPMHFWLPRTYANTSTPVAALFAIMTKVGIYSIWRVHTAIYGDHAGELAGLAISWLWPLALLTLIAGIVAVLASQTLKMLASNLVIVSAGTLLVTIALNTPEATAAGLYYLIHSTLLSAALFLIAGLIQEQRAQAQDRFVKGRPVSQPLLIGSFFFIAALGLIGMPPFSGFVGKILILQASSSVVEASWVWAPLLLSGLTAMIMLSRAGSTLFWLAAGQPAQEAKAHPLQVTAIVILLLCSPLMVILGGPLSELTLIAAQQLHQVPEALQVVEVSR